MVLCSGLEVGFEFLLYGEIFGWYDGDVFWGMEFYVVFVDWWYVV